MSPLRMDRRLSGRHPFQIFIMTLCFVTGLPTVFGTAPRPGSIEEQLPDWVGFGWALVLTVCSLLAVVGVFLPDRGLGIVLEQLGVAGVGLGALLYVVCAVVTLGEFQLQLGIVAGFGFACLWRWWQLQRILNVVAQESDRRAT